MFIASFGNVLTLVVFKNPFLAFFWYHIVFCILIPIFDNFFLRKKNIKGYLHSISLVKPVHFKYIVFSSITGTFSIILLITLYFLNKTQSINISLLKFPLIFVIGGAVYTVVFNGILEEIFWRGYIHKRLNIINNRFSALLLNSVFFTSFHIFIIFHYIKLSLISIGIVLLIFIFALIFELLREKSRSILPSIILHILISIGYTIIFLHIYFTSI